MVENLTTRFQAMEDRERTDPDDETETPPRPEQVQEYIRRQREENRVQVEEQAGVRDIVPARAPQRGTWTDSFLPKVDLPEFDGKGEPDDFLEWLHSLERIFEYHEVPETKKVKLASIKLKKHASLWWENLKKQREREGKEKISSWSKMEKKLRKKYLPSSYKQDVFLKLHEFRQGLLSVAEYIAEFDNLMMKAEIHEPEEQTIARFLGGLRVDIRNMVQLQPYTSLLDVHKLALRVEKILKESKQSRFGSKGFSQESTPETPKIQNEDKGKKVAEEGSKPKVIKEVKKCFKCHGMGHIASDCPNRRVVALVEESDDESGEESEREADDKQEEEEIIVCADQGQALVIQQALKLTPTSQQGDWKRKNVFHTKCTCQGKICLMIIDNGSFENLVSAKMVQKLSLETIPHHEPYKLKGLKDNAGINVTARCLVSFTIGDQYSDKVWCDVAPMDVSHLLLGRPWQHDRRVKYDGHAHTYSFEKDGHKIKLMPMEPCAVSSPKQNRVLLTQPAAKLLCLPGEDDTGVSPMSSRVSKASSSFLGQANITPHQHLVRPTWHGELEFVGHKNAKQAATHLSKQLYTCPFQLQPLAATCLSSHEALTSHWMMEAATYHQQPFQQQLEPK